jgi:hypothetical protein
VPKPLLSYLLPYSRRSIALGKTTGSQKAEIDQTCPTNKVLLQVAHAFLYTLMDFFQSHQTVPKPLLSYLLPYSRTFNCTSKTTGWFTKGEIDPNLTLTKCYSRHTHSYIHWWTSFSRTKLCPSRCYLTFFHIPERSIALVKRLAGSPKRLKWSQPAHANKVLLKVAHVLYTWWTSFSRTKLCPLLSYLLPYSRTFNCTSKTTGWFTKGLKLIPTCLR